MNNNQSYRFLLVSRKTPDAFEIRNEIERNKLYRVEMAESAAMALERMSVGNLHCLVYNFESFTTNKMKLITDLRDLNYKFPVMLFASHVQPEALQIVQRTDKVVIIEKPYEAKDVWGLCYKSLQGRPVNQRIFRRFYTDQEATFEKSISGETFKGQIYNLSRGGAYVEMKSTKVTPGEMVKVSIPLDKISKSYMVDAQVVWAAPRGYWKGQPAAGLRFVKAGDVYRNLLDKL